MKHVLTVLCVFLLSTAFSSAQSPITWSAGTNLAPSSSGNNHPRIAVDRSGNPLVIWNHVSRCMFSRWNGTAFTTPVLLNPPSIAVAGAEWMGPDIAAHGDTVYVVFKQTPEDADSSHIFCVHSYNGGVTFSLPVQVDNIKDSLSRFPTVTTDAAGNPVVGFMKFNASFLESRWAVARSNDFGNSFSKDVKASGWSSPGSTICDCCPGSVACSGNTVAMVYRDNKSNLRDSWAGISTNNGVDFSGGIPVDQQNWQINACPATGPDAVMIGDSLYTTFANGASGKSLVYYNRTFVPDMANPVSLPLTGVTTGLSQQNYPRIATNGEALAIAWVQVVNGTGQCLMRFTNNVASGLPGAPEVVDLNNDTNCDVAISKDKVFVMWEDDNAGTIKYRIGAFTPTSGTLEHALENAVSVLPNPTNSTVNITSDNIIDKVVVVNAVGQVVYQAEPREAAFSLELAKSGMYFVMVTTNQKTILRKLIVSGTK